MTNVISGYLFAYAIILAFSFQGISALIGTYINDFRKEMSLASASHWAIRFICSTRAFVVFFNAEYFESWGFFFVIITDQIEPKNSQ